MKTTAQHTHNKSKQVCWWDLNVSQWITQDEKTGLNEPCPNPNEKGLIEIGKRDELLVAGDAPFRV